MMRFFLLFLFMVTPIFADSITRQALETDDRFADLRSIVDTLVPLYPQEEGDDGYRMDRKVPTLPYAVRAFEKESFDIEIPGGVSWEERSRMVREHAQKLKEQWEKVRISDRYLIVHAMTDDEFLSSGNLKPSHANRDKQLNFYYTQDSIAALSEDDIFNILPFIALNTRNLVSASLIDVKNAQGAWGRFGFVFDVPANNIYAAVSVDAHVPMENNNTMQKLNAGILKEVAFAPHGFRALFYQERERDVNEGDNDYDPDKDAYGDGFYSVKTGKLVSNRAGLPLAQRQVNRFYMPFNVVYENKFMEKIGIGVQDRTLFPITEKLSEFKVVHRNEIAFFPQVILPDGSISEATIKGVFYDRNKEGYEALAKRYAETLGIPTFATETLGVSPEMDFTIPQ